MDSETLGLDFDGVIRKWPGFIAWYANFLQPNDLLVQAKLYFLRRWLTHLFMDFTPVILDGELIEAIKEEKPRRIILISGRCLDRQKEQVFQCLSPFLNIERFYFREDCSENEEKFKERILKHEKVTFFIEDREFVVKYLRSKGIKTYHISEVRGNK